MEPDDTVAVFPPLLSDFEKNFRLGERVVIGDDSPVGHNTVVGPTARARA